MLFRKYKPLILFILASSLFLGCAKNPVSGMPDFVTITEQQEISMGASYHSKILEENKVIKNIELNNYFKDNEGLATDLTTFILDSREEKITETIRRKNEN